MQFKSVALAMLLLLTVCCFAQQSALEPIIDMHLHAFKIDAFGPPPQKVCVPIDLRSWDPKERPTTIGGYMARNMGCAQPLVSPLTSDERNSHRS